MVSNFGSTDQGLTPVKFLNLEDISTLLSELGFCNQISLEVMRHGMRERL